MPADHSLRLWPGVLAVLVYLPLRLVLPYAVADGDVYALAAGATAALAILIWWVFFSRARWIERVGAMVVMTAALLLTWRFVDRSVATGMMGGMLPAFALPVLGVALVAWAALTRSVSGGKRWIALVAAMLVACAPFTLLRSAGIGGARLAELHWRWSPTPEQLLLAESAREMAPAPTAAEAVAPPLEIGTPPSNTAAASVPEKADAGSVPDPATPSAARRAADWPGFRGPSRDGVARGVRIETDWSTSPPVEMWRRRIGPGWSSFAVDGDLLYTQEQRGDDEVVSAYRVSTGEVAWRHSDPARFWESNGGAGPRGTPTLSDNRVYAFGGTGILNALDARSGARIWSRNVAAENKTEVPTWGFSSSPLVVDATVLVAAGGTLLAFDAATGAPRWSGPEGGFSYSSPHLLTVNGVAQVLLLGGGAAVSHAPADGRVLWKHEWSGGAIVQPGVMDNGDILVHSLAATGGAGIRRLSLRRSDGSWDVQERWTSTGLKPYYNDFVSHKGFAFGPDGSILSCIDLQDGTRRWKGGRYGGGQVLLLPDQDLLLVLSVEGEIALVSATPDEFKEVARIPGIEGKTWNHPVVVRDVLLVRNGEWMAAFKLPVINR